MNPNLPKSGGVKPLIFLKEVKAELGKVIWPTKQEAIKLTGIVILISVLVGIYIGALDIIFTKLTQLIIKK